MKIKINDCVYNKKLDFVGYVIMMEKVGDHITVTAKKGDKLCYDWIDDFELAQKCINKTCQNHVHEGTFKGDLCMPCYEYLTKGQYDKLNKNRPAGHGVGTADYSWTCENDILNIRVNRSKIKQVNLETEYK